MEEKLQENPIEVKPSIKQFILQRKEYLIIVCALIIFIVTGIVFFLISKRVDVTEPINKPSQTRNPTSIPIGKSDKKEKYNVINGEFNLTYIFSTPEPNTKILKQVNFKTKAVKEAVLTQTIDESPKYKVSPNGKYLLKITMKKLEIADLSTSALTFRTIHEVPVMTSPESAVPNIDYARVNDAMWDYKSLLYFISSVGADGVNNPLGVYTDLYVANEDGSSKRLVNDHTKENQNYGFMKYFNSIDSNLNEIYFGGHVHGGHEADIIKVDAKIGIIKKSLENHGFINSNFTKLYYFADKNGVSGDIVPYQIVEQDIANGNKKARYVLPSDHTGLISYPTFINKTTNKLYFKIQKESDVSHLVLNLNTNDKPTVLFDRKLNDNCDVLGVSLNEDILFLHCRKPNIQVSQYMFYQVSNGNWSIFYDGTGGLEVLSFK